MFVELLSTVICRRREVLNGVFAFGNRRHRIVVGLFEQSDGLGKRLAMAVELHRKFTEIAQDPRGEPVEGADLPVQLAGSGVGAVEHLSERRYKFGNTRGTN